MTASGFRAFFPPNGRSPPPPLNPREAGAAHLQQAHLQQAHLQHLIPNMRFLAQKLENPGLFPNLPPGLPTPPSNLEKNNTVDIEDNEVSASNIASNDFTSDSAANSSMDHCADSGKFIKNYNHRLENRCVLRRISNMKI